jgi:ferredoxin-like protein FixX
MSSEDRFNSSSFKSDIETFVVSNDPSVSYLKPNTVRNKCWRNYSQLHYQNIVLDFEICLECRTILKWISETGFTNVTTQLIQADATLDAFIIP